MDALNNSAMTFQVVGDLGQIAAPLVDRVLKSIYESRDMAFDAPFIFKDEEGVKVINGVVRTGNIPKGTKPNKDISAAQNFGYGLKIMRKGPDKVLDTTGNQHAQDLWQFIDDHLADENQTLKLQALYKNFMGIGGPKNYGLTQRMVQIFLLCLDVWNLSEHSAPYDVILPTIYERIKTKEYSAIILDPIYCMYGDLDENSAGDVSDLMNALRKLANKSKAAIVFAHHFSKGNQSGKESQDRISGSGVWGRAVDTNVSITAHETENCYTLEATPRGFRKIDPFVIRWEYPLMVRDDGLNPGKLKTAICKKPVFTVNDLTKALSTESMTTMKLRESVLKDTAMSQSKFYELAAELKTAAGVTFDEDKRLWSYESPNKALLR
jgi:hypothetical protein